MAHYFAGDDVVAAGAGFEGEGGLGGHIDLLELLVYWDLPLGILLIQW